MPATRMPAPASNQITASSGLPAPAYRRAPAEKRERLLTAARELFAANGFDATSTAQIAKAAGVSEGILFHHFGSKKGLFVTLADDFLQAAAAAVMPEDGRELTEERIVRGAFDYADQHPALYAMLTNDQRVLTDAEMRARPNLLIDAISRNLVLAMEAGLIRRGNPQVMAELQFALVDGAYKAWRTSGQRAQRDDYILEAANCMQAMLKPAVQSGIALQALSNHLTN